MHTEEVGESIFILMAMEPKTTVHDFHSRWNTDAYLTVFRFCFFFVLQGPSFILFLRFYRRFCAKPCRMAVFRVAQCVW